MGNFDSEISRTDAAPLIPEEVSYELIQGAIEQSAVMRLAKRLANMARGQTRLPVLSALATAYFVDSGIGLKQTTEVNWANKYVDAEEIAAIIPIKKSTLADAQYPIWDECKKSIQEALGKAIDAAVLYGTNIPASWTTDLGAAGLVAGALAASHNPSLAAFIDLFEAVLGESAAGVAGLFGLVEEDGYFVTGSIAHPQMKRRLRNCRDKNGQPVFLPNMQEAGKYVLDGQPCDFPLNGAISATYYLISGDWSKLVYAIREDMTFDIGKEATIQDASGNIVYNLFQQNMVALRCSMRLGFALPHPVTRMDSGTGFPFAYLTA